MCELDEVTEVTARTANGGAGLAYCMVICGSSSPFPSLSVLIAREGCRSG